MRITIALPLPLKRLFTYRVPPENEARVLPGCRAVVPFGRKILTGIIVDAPPEDLPDNQIKEIIDLPDEQPLLTEDLLKLTQWVSRYYFCSWGEVLRAALPSGQLQSSTRIIKLQDNPIPHGIELTATERKLLNILQQHGRTTVGSLHQKGAIPNLLKVLASLAGRQLIRMEEVFPGRGASAVYKESIRAVTSSPDDLLQLAAELEQRAPRQAQILKVLADDVDKTWLATNLLRAAKASRGTLKSLLAQGYITSEQVVVKRYPTLESLTIRDEGELPEPNPDQQQAIAVVTAALNSLGSETFLLYGVTGSGKTLVYQKLIQKVLAEGGTALVLIPEIALTPQIVSRFRATFGDRIGLQHSAMSPGERLDVWRGIRQGEFPIVIGARSAVFAPLDNLKLIIIDEEGDASFKQHEPNPRYNARDVALMRAQMTPAVTVMGSATPSIESFHNAAVGRFQRLELPKRIDRMAPPEIRFIEPAQSRQKIISPTLERAIRNRLLEGNQVILLHNRRGYFTFVFCKACNYVCQCDQCSITLTLHKTDRKLRCHICNKRIDPILTCPQCGNRLKYAGTGTQRIEAELLQMVPEDRLVRLDLDTTSRKGSHQQILKKFAAEDYSILLGTKMVARGHDYPKVTLVGVASADAELAFPDFRCDERTFVLLLQAAGRAGRSADGQGIGEVLIQTRMPDHPVLQFVKRGDFRAFYEHEKVLRRSAGYPPFGWLILFVFSSQHQEAPQKAAESFIRAARDLFPDGAWLGPTPAFRPKLKNNFRYQVLLKTSLKYRSLKSDQRQKLESLIDTARKKLPTTVQMIIDVDPIQFV